MLLSRKGKWWGDDWWSPKRSGVELKGISIKDTCGTPTEPYSIFLNTKLPLVPPKPKELEST